jgi:hypothetical protein
MINNIPKSWGDIKLYQYQELLGIDVDSYESDIDINLEEISILLETTTDDPYISELDIDELINILNKLKWLRTNPPTNFSKEIFNYKIKELNKLTLGEFIDIDHFISTNSINNLHIICSILYKKYKDDEWGNTIEEPYIYDIYKRAEEFLDLPVNKVFGIIEYFIKYKNDFMDSYSNLFEDSNYDVIENEEMFDEEELVELKKEIEDEKSKAKFSWDSIIYNLSSGDITKMDAITNLPLIYVFNTLSMKKALDI